jgi:hypothetical protein
MRTLRAALAIAAVGALTLAGCGDDDDTDTGAAGIEETDDTADDAMDDEATDDEATDDEATDDDATDEDDDDAASGSGGGEAGSLVLDGETIELGPGLCFLEEQPSAGGGGSILATAQAQGSNAAGEDVRIDFSRYSEDSDFAGDDVSIDVGALGESTGYSGNEPEGAVSIDGNVVSATDFPVMSFDDGSEITVSFTINC